ncbi:catalase [Clostridium paraputrificum]|uniref:catalase n=1 Tax=Clostridium TaxID=1485 RepID=UPI003D325FE6
MSSKNKKKKEFLTTNTGAPISDDMNSVTVGESGPTLLQDVQFLEKMGHFDRERIPERVVHAKGAGAHGFFKLERSMAQYTYAKVFNEMDCETPVFVRFSTVIGSKGSADTVRDPRGFAVKFYTKEGVYDIAGNDLPVFFIRDAIKFPDLIHSLKPSPDDNIIDHSRFWDFMSQTPEATHMITWLYSDRGTIKSYRKIEGFGVNTFIWVNKNGGRVYVKYHWKPLAGVETITRQEAEMLSGLDPDIATRDLYDTLNSGEKVEYDLYVQIMGLEEGDNQYFDPLDDTKTWPEDIFPLIKVGKMSLTNAPDNFFQEVEQSAFAPSNLIPGVEASADKMLQGRLFAYHDTQLHRVGPNFMQLPINKPMNKVANNTQEGFMRYASSSGRINYYPSTISDDNPSEANKITKTNLHICGEINGQKICKTEDFRQAGERYRLLCDKDKENLIDNIVDDMWSSAKEVKYKMIEYFTMADKDFGRKVKKGLKLS